MSLTLIWKFINSELIIYVLTHVYINYEFRHKLLPVPVFDFHFTSTCTLSDIEISYNKCAQIL